jgi:autotransporter family porin
LVLTGANTYSGGTTIEGGTLVVTSDGNLGAASGGLTLDGGTLEVTGTAFSSTARALTLGSAGGGFDIADVGNTFTVAQSLGGSGSLSPTGAGTLVVTGANTYTGGTTISAGTLWLGDGGNSGSIAGNVADNASLAFNRADTNTFGGVTAGTGSVAQIGSGTTVLTNANTYTGGTFIDAGTLSIGADNNLGDPAGAVSLNDGTLLLSASFNSARNVLLDTAGGTIDVAGSNALSGPVTGSGSLTKTGSRALIIESIANYTGLTTVAAGTLVVGDSAHPSAQLAGVGGVDVVSGAAFGGYGQEVGEVNNAGTLGVGNALTALANEPDASFAIAGGLVNTGTVTLANGVAADTLKVTGAYVSSGGQLDVDAVLNQGGPAAQSDRLVAHSVELAGAPTNIVVHSVGGTGALTQGDGIPLVTVLDPTASAAGAFTLAGRVVSGPYEYMLFQGGVAAPANGHWYLRSDVEPTPPTPPPASTPPSPPAPPVPIFRPEVGAYLANREATAGLLVQTLHERQGDPQYSSDGSTDAYSSMGKVWFRTEAGPTRIDAADGLLDAHGDRELFQFGGDVGNWNLFGQNDRLHVGGMASYADTNADITAQFNPAQAHGHTHGYLAGAYATWFANNDQRLGSYVDAWIQYGWFNNDVRSTLLPSVGYDSTSWAASIEYGYGFGVGQHWAIEPEVQVVHTDYNADRITDSIGTSVRSLDGSDTLGRLGVRVYPQLASDYAWRPFLEVNWWHGGGTDKMAFNGVPRD